jgi:hypothetical protein
MQTWQRSMHHLWLALRYCTEFAELLLSIAVQHRLHVWSDMSLKVGIYSLNCINLISLVDDLDLMLIMNDTQGYRSILYEHRPIAWPTDWQSNIRKMVWWLLQIVNRRRIVIEWSIDLVSINHDSISITIVVFILFSKGRSSPN